MSTLIRSMLAGAGVLALSAGAATAYPATVTEGLNLRAGPGTNYGVVATMPAGATVDVRSCVGNGWCQLGFGGVVGFASANYLSGGPDNRVPVVVGPAYDEEVVPPEVYEYGAEYPPYWNDGEFYYWSGGGYRHVRRSRGWWTSHQPAFAHIPRRGRPAIGRPGAGGPPPGPGRDVNRGGPNRGGPMIQPMPPRGGPAPSTGPRHRGPMPGQGSRGPAMHGGGAPGGGAHFQGRGGPGGAHMAPAPRQGGGNRDRDQH